MRSGLLVNVATVFVLILFASCAADSKNSALPTDNGSNGDVTIPPNSDTGTPPVGNDTGLPKADGLVTPDTSTPPGDNGTPADTSVPPTVTGGVGSACAADTDCTDAGAFCLTEFPGGYCMIADCATAGCPVGSVCDTNFEEASYCLKSCGQDAECRVSEGYECDQFNTCWPSSGTTNPTGSSAIGGPCETSADCADAGAGCYPEFSNNEATGFVNGYCLLDGCSPGGCPTGSHCETVYQSGQTSCVADCATTADCRDTEGYSCIQFSASTATFCFPSCTSGGTCPAGYGCSPELGHCVPACTDEFCGPDQVCNETTGLCEEPPCTLGSCDSGYVCSPVGVCVPDLGDVPSGTVPTCSNLPDRDCMSLPGATAAYCQEMLQFEPSQGVGYDDYPLNGECAPCGAGLQCYGGWDNTGKYGTCQSTGTYLFANSQWRSWIRRDVMMLVAWSAAYVDCKAEGWGGGNGHAIGLGDMSEESGDIPGAAVGSPGHPAGTHVNGSDMDLAYFQNTGANNYLRAVCDHYTNGQEAYHCTGEPNILDVWRNALFLGALFSHADTRVIGVDGKVGALMKDAMLALCGNGWLPTTNCTPVQNIGFQGGYSLAYELTDGGQGWFAFHHHHQHLSLFSPGTGFKAKQNSCLNHDCSDPLPDLEVLKNLNLFGHVNYEQKAPGAAPNFTDFLP